MHLYHFGVVREPNRDPVVAILRRLLLDDEFDDVDVGWFPVVNVTTLTSLTILPSLRVIPEPTRASA